MKGDLSAKNKGFDSLKDNRNINNLTLANWFKGYEGSKTIENVTEGEFVKFYKNKIGPALNINETDYLSLGTFKINLTYINIYGMGLSGNVKGSDNEDLMITLQLSKAAIDKKLNNWGKIIIAFWKYINSLKITTQAVELKVSNLLFKKLLDKNQRDGLKGVTKILLDDFKSSEAATDLEDIELFNLISHPLFERAKGEKIVDVNEREGSVLAWKYSENESWATLFTFGKNLNSGLYYSFAGIGENKLLSNCVLFLIYPIMR
ncbi:MAG: hypothetical protein SPLM_07750 [Spiroplasma phoeniceum]